MATIALYASKLNQMHGLIKEAKKSVNDYKSELFSLKRNISTINKSICDLEDVISSIQASSQTQEEKIASLDTFSQSCEEFISDTVRIDGDVADIVNQRKDDFYKEYDYLKPECEKNGWEKFKDGCKKVGEWCKEHWKAVVTVAIVIVAVACLFIPGVNAWVAGLAFGKMFLAMASGALIGVGVGGVLGGMLGLISGDSFWEGAENGAFSGAITGIISGGMDIWFTGGKGVLSFGQVLKTGLVSGMGTSLISDLGDIVFKGEDMSAMQVLLNMAISGGMGTVFAGIGYGITNGIGALLKNASWYQNFIKGPNGKGIEFFRIGQTTNSNYGRITAYTDPGKSGISINYANNSYTFKFRLEYDLQDFLHIHMNNPAHIHLDHTIFNAILNSIWQNIRINYKMIKI